jgi:hypothetical protein
MDLKEYHGKVFPIEQSEYFLLFVWKQSESFKLSVNMFDTVK